MLKKHIYNYQETLVFSRWSRKKYAVLLSLHKNVIISHLSIGIIAKAMLKNENLPENRADNFFVGLYNAVSADSIIIEFSDIILLFIVVWPTLFSDLCFVEVGFNRYYIYYMLRPERFSETSQVFFLY